MMKVRVDRIVSKVLKIIILALRIEFQRVLSRVVGLAHREVRGSDHPLL